MRRHSVLHLNSVLINKILVTKFTESKFNCKIHQHSEINNLVGTYF